MSTHTDKELLMLAAKAAGVIGEYVEGYAPTDYYEDQFYTGESDGVLMKQEGFSPCVWNPIRSDGQAMRLAVKLKLDVMTRWGESNSAVLDQDGNFTIQADVDLDMCAATRRAIVRAAAAIGEKL